MFIISQNQAKNQKQHLQANLEIFGNVDKQI